jgi:hypothetical protein
MMRERKMVSSHIQVLKNFLSNHRCCKCGISKLKLQVAPSPCSCRAPFAPSHFVALQHSRSS